MVSEYFGEHNFNVVRNPKTHVTIDDARHYLLTTHEKFDAITSDPLDPWVKGAATLYTREFFELAKQHLNPGGTVTLFVQLYESSPEAVKSEIGTFFEAFPNGIIWGNTHQGKGYDTVLLGQVEPTHFDVDEMQAKLNRPEYADGEEVSARNRHQFGDRPACQLRRACVGHEGIHRGCRRSTTTAICGCSIWPGWG